MAVAVPSAPKATKHAVKAKCGLERAMRNADAAPCCTEDTDDGCGTCSVKAATRRSGIMTNIEGNAPAWGKVISRILWVLYVD